MNLPVKRDGGVYEYLKWTRETHLLRSWEDTIAYLIETLDPDWDIPRGKGD